MESTSLLMTMLTDSLCVLIVSSRFLHHTKARNRGPNFPQGSIIPSSPLTFPYIENYKHGGGTKHLRSSYVGNLTQRETMPVEITEVNEGKYVAGA
jgi:hypothetical protein